MSAAPNSSTVDCRRRNARFSAVGLLNESIVSPFRSDYVQFWTRGHSAVAGRDR
jgi:hypothetical protein